MLVPEHTCVSNVSAALQSIQAARRAAEGIADQWRALLAPVQRAQSVQALLLSRTGFITELAAQLAALQQEELQWQQMQANIKLVALPC